MSVIRILVSFAAGTLVVLTMLVAGLQVFKGRAMAPSPKQVPELEAFEVQYLTPEEAARILDDDLRRAADPVAPQADDS